MLAEEDIPLRDDDLTCLSDHRKYERAAQGIDLRTCYRDPGRMHSSDTHFSRMDELDFRPKKLPEKIQGTPTPFSEWMSLTSPKTSLKKFKERI